MLTLHSLPVFAASAAMSLLGPAARALQLVSLWANFLGALLTLLADRMKFDPAVTSVPFMTTIVDSTGLIIYFYIAKWMLGINSAEVAH